MIDLTIDDASTRNIDPQSNRQLNSKTNTITTSKPATDIKIKDDAKRMSIPLINTKSEHVIKSASKPYSKPAANTKSKHINNYGNRQYQSHTRSYDYGYDRYDYGDVGSYCEWCHLADSECEGIGCGMWMHDR